MSIKNILIAGLISAAILTPTVSYGQECRTVADVERGQDGLRGTMDDLKHVYTVPFSAIAPDKPELHTSTVEFFDPVGDDSSYLADDSQEPLAGGVFIEGCYVNEETNIIWLTREKLKEILVNLGLVEQV